jgi:hypothetical protein
MTTMTIEPIHFSTLKHMARSPAHYRYELTAPPKTKRHFDLGTVLHAKVLLPPDERPDVVVYEGRRAGKVWESFEAEHADSIILSPADGEKIDGMQESILTHPIAMGLLVSCTKFEHSIEWARQGLPCAGRIDAHNSSMVVELKTGREEPPSRFQWSVVRMGYHAQLAWYMRGLGMDLLTRAAYIIHVESTPPYVATVYQPSQGALQAGDRICTEWMARLKICCETQHWPGYSDEIVPLELAGGDDIVFDSEAEEEES